MVLGRLLPALVATVAPRQAPVNIFNSTKGCIEISLTAESICTKYCYAAKLANAAIYFHSGISYSFDDKVANAANYFHFYSSPAKQGLKGNTNGCKGISYYFKSIGARYYLYAKVLGSRMLPMSIGKSDGELTNGIPMAGEWPPEFQL